MDLSAIAALHGQRDKWMYDLLPKFQRPQLYFQSHD